LATARPWRTSRPYFYDREVHISIDGEISKYTEPLADSKWLLLTVEAHILTKMAAILDRHASAKGEKDARELLGLLRRYDADIEP